MKYNPNLIEAKFEYDVFLYDNYHLVAEAEVQLNAVLELDENFKPALNVLGQINENYYRNFLGAKGFYEKEISLYPDSAKKHYEYCTFLITRLLQEFKAEAIKHYKIALALDSDFANEHVESVLFN